MKKSNTTRKGNTMKKNSTTKSGMTPVKAGAPVNEDDLKAAIQAALKAVDGNYKITFGYDDMFNLPIVYTYCDFPTYQKIYKEVLLNKNPTEIPALGYCTIGRIGVEVDGAHRYDIILVWANSSMPFEKTLPTFVHEIVHVTKHIFDDAGADDVDGEAMACLVERELKRVMEEFFHLPTPDDMRVETMAKLQTLLEKQSSKEAGTPSEMIDAPAVKRPNAAATQMVGEATGNGNSKFMTGYDETFLVPLVYTYSDFASFQKLCRNVLDNDELPKEPARGYSTFERISAKINGRSDAKIGLVWANNSMPLEETLPVFIHGIFLVVHDILKDTGVNDRSGEVMAYTVEREAKRVMSELFHLPVPENPKTRLLEELGHSLARKDDAPAPDDPKHGQDRTEVKRNRHRCVSVGESAESPEWLELANQKSAEINQAYETIKTARR